MSIFDDDDVQNVHPSRKLFGLSMQWVIFLTLLSIVILAASFILVWINKPTEVLSPDNIERLSREANNSWQALEAKKVNIASLEQQAQDILATYGEDRSVWPQGKAEEYLQLLTQIRNQKAAYNGECAAYMALWQDEWRNLPAPDDLPTTCDLIQ